MNTDDPKEFDEQDEADILEIQSRYQTARDHALEWRQEAKKDYGYYAGDQWDEQDRQKLVEQQRVPVTFNRVGPLVDAVVGYETNNRQETRYIPRTQGDAKVNEAITEAARYFRDQCDAEYEESDASRDMLICGMGWTEDYLSDDRNPEYDLVRSRTDPFEMSWDPSSQKPNLADARYVFRKKWMVKGEAEALFPKWDGGYIQADWLGDFEGDMSEGSINPRMRYKGDNSRSTDVVKDVPVLEYQYCDFEVEHLVTNPNTGEQMTLTEEQWDEMDDETRNAVEGGAVPHKEQKRHIWRRCWLIGSEIVKRDEPYPKGCTYHCITGKRDRNKGYWFGLVKALRDPQMWSNKWLSQIMHLINTSAKPGYDVEAGAIKDQSKFETMAAKPGAVNIFEDGALQKGRVQRREAVPLPPDLANLMQYANDAMSDVSGVNQELLGMADREQAGVLEYQRKQSAVTLLAPLFDSIRRYRKMAGRCWLYMMQTYMADGRIIRITQDDQTTGQKEQGVPFVKEQFFDPQVAEYDVIIDQSSSSPNLKEETWAALQPLLPIFGERMGGEEIQLMMEYSPVPASFVDKFREIQTEKAQQPPPPDPEMMKLEAQTKANEANLQFKQQEAQLQLQLDGQKAKAQIDLEREKTGAQLELEKQKAQAEIMMERQRMEFEREKMEREMAMREDQHGREMQMKAQSARVDMASALSKEGASGESIDLRDLFGNKDIAAAITAMAQAVQQMAQVQAQSSHDNSQAIQGMADRMSQAMTAPRTLIRHADGSKSSVVLN